MKWLTKYLILSSMFLSVGAADSTIKSLTIKALNSGTVVYFTWLKDEIVFAADSRGNPKGAHIDDECKITTSKNRSIFAGAGIRYVDVNFSNGKSAIWDSHAVAKRAFKVAASSKHGNETLAAANIWKNHARDFFQAALDVDPQKIIALAQMQNNYGGICEGIFAGKDGDNFTAVHVLVSVKTEGSKTPTIEAKTDLTFVEGSMAIMGYSEIIREFLAKPLLSQRAKATLRAWQNSLPTQLTADQQEELFAVQLIQWTIDFRTKDIVGGDVNAAVLGREGVHWIRQKKYCEAAQ